MLIVSLICGTFIALYHLGVSNETKSRLSYVNVSISLIFLLFCLVGPQAACFTWILSFICLLVAISYQIRPRYKISIFLGCIVLSHLIAYLLVSRPYLQNLERARTEFPAVNLEDRLPSPSQSVLPLPPHVDLDYSEVIESVPTSPLQRHLRNEMQKLHDDRIGQFINSPGFGMARMAAHNSLSESTKRRSTPIPQAELQLTSQSKWELEHPYLPVTADIKKYHREFVRNFAFPEAWGYFDTRATVYGFQPHEIGNRDPFFGSPMPSSPTNWEVRTVELIGLVLHPEPTVYMTANMPTMEEALRAPRRPPDEFETAGLKAIAAGEPIYLGIARKERVLRMVGPIAATPSCVKCHECQEGELLGAMSYVLKSHVSQTAK